MNKDEYLKLAEVEDDMWYFHSLHAHVARALRVRLAAQSGARVLDAGCGTGGLLLRLRARFPGAVFSGIDFSGLACELARQRTGADIREASITALPFGDGEFDAVVSADVVCQVDDAARAFSEIHRVLKPGGTVVINLPAYMWMWSYHDDNCQTKRRYTRGELRQRLHEAGFNNIDATHWNALPFPLVYAKRKIFCSPRDTSDVKRYPAPLEYFFRGLMAIEHGWCALGGGWAWGTSVFASARKG
jgi:SAM-dependent methyltransferase